nr:peroxisomal multifunctional enzyme type 2 [Pseudomonas chlororaphis]
MSKELRFDGKVVIVTGAGGGLGRQYALMFGSRGARVVVNDLGGGAHGGGQSSAAADKVVEEIKAIGGEAVANYDSVENGASIVQTAVNNFGRVDIVINNAGILRDSSFLKMSMDDWDLIYRVHLKGSMSVTHAAWAIMREQGYGRIIMTTSAAGIYGNFGQANYSAAKLGLLGLAKTLAVEGGSKNIHVNTIAPIAASRLTETVLPPEILEGLKPEYVSPLVGWLCHETCEENGGLFEVGAGIINKLRWQRTKGVGFRLSSPIDIEDVAAKWDQVGDFADADFPTTVADSMVAAMDNINNPKLGGNQFLDLDKAKASKPVVIENAYDERDLSLYALGVGVGANPLDAKGLQYLYERGDTFYALPTYGVIPPLNGFMQMMMEGKELPGMGNVLDRVLHGEQYTEIKRPLPPHAKLRHEAKLRTAYDKGKDAIGIIDVHSFDETGEELAYNEITFFLRGCGGWGGDRGPSADINVPPPREPDAIVEEKIGDNQSLIYRLSGDWNPLHIDPEFAKNFGFDRPILHGLCTYGYVGRHVVQSFLGNDPRRFKSIKVRFAKSVYPGETLVTRMWKESETHILLETRVKERDEIVIKNAAVELYEQIPLAKAKAEPVAAGVAAVAAPPSTGPTGADILNAIGAYLAANPAEVQAANTVFQFNLKNPDASWTVDAKVGKVIQGAADKPDVTLTADEDQFIGMCVGGEDAQKLFFAGKLKIAGNMMAASKLEFLKKMDPKLVEAEVAKRLANTPAAAPATEQLAAQPTGPTSVDILNAVGVYLAANPAEVTAANTVFQFNLKDPDTSWIVDAKVGTVAPGTADKPDVTLTTADEQFVGMCVGGEDAQKLFFAGKLKIAGNMMAASKLEFLKRMDPKLVEAEVAKRLAGGASAPNAATVPAAAAKVGRAEVVFQKLSELLAKSPELVKVAEGHVLAFQVAEPDSAWTLDYSNANPVLKAGTAEAGTTLLFADEDLETLIKGTDSLQSLFQHGRVRVHGDLGLIKTLEAFLKLA